MLLAIGGYLTKAHYRHTGILIPGMRTGQTAVALLQSKNIVIGACLFEQLNLCLSPTCCISNCPTIAGVVPDPPEQSPRSSSNIQFAHIFFLYLIFVSAPSAFAYYYSQDTRHNLWELGIESTNML